MDEIQKRTRFEKKCLLEIIFHLKRNGEDLKPMEFEN
jgi:hypothetical protein